MKNSTQIQNELWKSVAKDKKLEILCAYWRSKSIKSKLYKTFETLYGKENLQNENIEAL